MKEGRRRLVAGATIRALAPFFCLYITFGATFGFLSGTAPLILRARGVQLDQIGLLQLINLPIGLTFLWAIVVDRIRILGLPHRLGWIVLMQCAGVAILAVLAQGERWPLGVLLLLAIATSVCVATMDVAMEALVVETISADWRPLVTSAKFCGVSLGGILGAGVVAKYYDALGWRTAILAIAALALVSLLPMLRYPERELRRPPVSLYEAGSSRRHLRLFAARILVLGLYFAAIAAISGFNALALLDLGVPLGDTGFLTGSVSPIVNLVMAIVAGPLVRRIGTLSLTAVAAFGVASTGVLMAIAAASGARGLAIAATVLGMICGGGMGVPVFAMIYRWAQGPRPATDYALLFGAAFFAAMPMRVAAPAVAGKLGWSLYFALAVLVYVAAVVLLRRMIRATLGEDRSMAAAGADSVTAAGTAGVSPASADAKRRWRVPEGGPP